MALAGSVRTQALETPFTGPLRFLTEILPASSGSLTPWISIWISGQRGGGGGLSQQCVRAHKGLRLLTALCAKGSFPRLPHFFQSTPFWLLAWRILLSKITLLLGSMHQGISGGSEGLSWMLSFIVMKCSLGILCHALFMGGPWSGDKHLPSWASLVSSKVVVLSYFQASGSCRKFSFFEASSRF